MVILPSDNQLMQANWVTVFLSEIYAQVDSGQNDLDPQGIPKLNTAAFFDIVSSSVKPA